MSPLPVRLRVCRVLLLGYAGVLAMVAVVLLGELLLGVGHVGHERLDGRGYGGVVGFSFLMLVATVVLVSAARRLGSPVPAFRRGARVGMLLVLLPLLVFGSIGEVVDIAGSSSARSNLIGLTILALAALPVLLVLPGEAATTGQ